MADLLLALVLITICVLGAELTMRTCRRRLSRPVRTHVPVPGDAVQGYAQARR